MKDKYVNIKIDNKQLDLGVVEDIPIAITYKLEDRSDFSKKPGSNALSVKVPATNVNSDIANTYQNPGIEDLTEEQIHRGVKNSSINIGGQDLIVGKAFLKSAGHTDKPTSYEFDFYGNNSDWMLDLQTTTLHDILKHISFVFSKALIVGSWNFHGRDENLPYCFIPIRYGQKMDTANSFVDGKETEDYNMVPTYMRPSLSKYWILYWGFKSIGYRIESDFFDTDYFRRQMMPWTWGSFLESDGTKLDAIRFLAKSTETIHMLNLDFTGFLDVKASNDSTNGAFDNSDTYKYQGFEMKWTYPTDPTLNFGILDATLYINVAIQAVATANSDVEVRVQWFKNGVRIPNGNDNGNGTELCNLNAPSVGRRDFIGTAEDWFTQRVQPGDELKAKIYFHSFDSGTGIARAHISIEEFSLAYFRTPLGGTVSFENLLAFKKYKFLDLLRGIVDEFNLTVQTDTTEKVVYIEPTHAYSLTNDLSAISGGYFNGKTLDWTDKQDLSKESLMEVFTDSDRELLFMYKDDMNDGTLKKLQDRNTNRVGLAKYVFPDRFTKGETEMENRFFSPTMHFEVNQWKTATTPAPQMIIIAPENISNFSKGEAQNTFNPKSIYYKGKTTDYKWVFDNENTHPYPFAFAVNYKPGGHEDPILSYCDEIIGSFIGKGLLRRFYLQRLENMRNGQYYKTWFKLNNNDVANFLHREFIICKNQRWELLQIDYKPLKDESSACLMRKWSPIKNA